MKNILILDDSDEDIRLIIEPLSPLLQKHNCNVFSSNYPSDYYRYDILFPALHKLFLKPLSLIFIINTQQGTERNYVPKRL